MSFLEIGSPRLLRGVLQQKEMYSGVLRGLVDDDEETVVYILSILRDRVLVPESLVPPGLRSVLFGSVTLEQLATISGRDDFGDAAELAHNVLAMVCTNPANGLMPDLDRKPSPLRGNLTRLLGLMKKLKATEVEYHKSLLLAIVNGRPSFGSAYLDDFPYSLEDLASDNWFAAISLAADVVSSVSDGLSLGFLDKLPSYDCPHVQSILKCIAPRPLTKLVINKGLLNADYLVKHVTLKFVVEALKLLESLVNALDSSSHSNDQMMHSWKALKTEIQDGVQMSLPDPQVLFSLLSPLSIHFKSLESTGKRKAETEIASGNHLHINKRLKSSAKSEDLDIVISGVNSSDVDLTGDGGVAALGSEKQSENGDGFVKCVRDLWGLDQCSTPHMDLKDADAYFHSKILESLKIYYKTMPTAIEGSFDLLKFLPSNPLVLPTFLQLSLLQLLNEHVSQFSKEVTPLRTPPQMYKHLHSFIILLMGSRVKHIREQAYALAKAAMLSTGAFDSNTKEICAWFSFIPGPSGDHVYVEDVEEEIFQKLSSVIVSFLCDAVSTTGNNLYKYMRLLKHYFYDSEGGKDLSLKVSPFTICILEKCLRLLSSESGSFTIPQKSLISHYVCNTIKYLLDTQVNAGTLSFLVDRVLSEKRENCSSGVDILELVECPCEWRPLKILLCSARDILHRGCYSIYSSDEVVMRSNNSFIDTLRDIKGVLRSEYDSGLIGLTVGFSFTLTCTRPIELLQNFPLVLSISSDLLEVPFSVLSSILFLKPSYLTDVLELWPATFFAALDSVIHCKEDEMISYEADLVSMEDASAAFARFLIGAPFCVLFSCVAQSNNLHLLGQSGLQKLLLDKVTGIQFDHLISSLCNVLFWMNHASLCYRIRSFDELEMLSKLCLVLAEHLLKQLLIENMDTVNPAHVKARLQLHNAVEVAEIIFNHPAVIASLSCPLFGAIEFSDSVFGETLENLLVSSEQVVHRMDHHVLNLIRTASELLFPMCVDQMTEQAMNGRKQILRAFKSLEEKLFLIFKNKFDACIQTMDFKPFVPTFYALHSLMRFISPFELLGLVNWLFSRIDFDNTTFHQSSKGNALFVGLHLASSIFDLLFTSIRQPYTESKLNCSLDDSWTYFDVLLFERIFFQVLEIGCHFKLDIADTCLLKAVNIIKMHRAIQHSDLPPIMVLSRAMASTPIDIISYCLHKLNRAKADLLHLLVELNPLYMSVFGFMISEVLDKSLLPNASGMKETYSFSDEELVMLLPTVFLYLNSVISKFGEQQSKPFEVIISEYGRVLFGGVSKWKIFVSGVTFEIGLDGPLTASTEEFSNLFSDSRLGMAILMVQGHLASSEDIMKLDKRVGLFSSLCPSTAGDIFDYFGGETEPHSLERPLEFVNRVVAKINFCRMILFSDHNHSYLQLDNGDKKIIPPQVTSDIEKLRTRLLMMLIKSWKFIVKKFQYNNDYSGDIDGQNLSLFRFLEVFVMNNILELTTEMQDCLTKLDSLPFIKKLVKSFLRYRFGDLATLKMLRNVLTSLSRGKFSCASVIQLLLAHSQFAQSIHLASESLVSTQFGLVFTPMQSILRSFAVSRNSTDALDRKSNKPISQERLILLELVKFVRILFQIYAQQRELNFGEDIDINSRELVHLLLSSYGATCAEVDMEIYNLMLEIESTDTSSAGTVAQMDYVWGIASLKVRKEWEQDKDMQSVDPRTMEIFEERRKIRFRENIPIDPRLCNQTVLYFPCNRFVNGGALQKLQKARSTVMHKASSATDNPQIYDPVFILRFSIHCLSVSYIEPVEFASLGLLAITFASLSSPDVDMRKLGYEALAKFKSALEKCQKKKDVVRLRLLISYLQNGVEEQWQRIPSIIGVFFAEASLVLLDSSHDNYSTISKYLSNSPSVDMKAIPLFQNLFWSSSTSFREDRLWMLQLLYVGLNTEDDAQTYIRNSIFETLLRFYSSPLSDNDSRELIIQIVKKAVQLHKTIWFLVEHCGLILWLSSIVTSLYGGECQDRIKFTRRQLPIVLEVVQYITSPRNIAEWLQKHAMEQLSELSSHLYKLLVGGVELIKEQSILCNSILKILKLVLKISQKRKIYQPHFTLSEGGIFQMYEAVAVCSETRCCPSMGLGLKAVLMSTPPVTILWMDKEKLSKFLSCAVTTAIQSKSKHHMVAVSGKQQPKESLVSKLLRWLTASVILGNISRKLNKLNSDSFLERPSLYSLRSWLGCDEKGFRENAMCGCEDILAASIFYLLQQVGFSHRFLPSAVSALCLLLLSDSSSELESLVGTQISLPSLCSKIHCPVEANPAWRWSYYQPWRDLSVELSDVEKLDEIHVCERLLILASNFLLQKSGCSHFFPLKDLDNLNVHEWERSIIQSK
ncbi:nucleolar pre-ribosomal-associated protein 1 [Phtheirospermum japonicum]|uniref:Nucleolar pre-ribosomal-associated protein 1 n=1 Tax=Phtheirospermum japonicum TaxID=374723 RepID=A0A830D0M8_9LAMI|nr:nucleolar pre-ribosomal-associated protein 1 [Phtheirospermum japonicum]